MRLLVQALMYMYKNTSVTAAMSILFNKLNRRLLSLILLQKHHYSL